MTCFRPMYIVLFRRAFATTIACLAILMPQSGRAQEQSLPPIAPKPRAAVSTSAKPKTTEATPAKKPATNTGAKKSSETKRTTKPAKTSEGTKPRRAPAQPDAPGVPRSVTNWPTGRKQIALTYDDGPNAKFTPQFLALLEKENVKATFYVQGSAIKANPKLTKLMAEHHLVELGNHSFTHPALSRISPEKARTELVSTEEILKATVGRGTTHMRPPYGAENSTVRRICHELGLRVILWDVDTNDWRNVTAAQIADTILKQTTDGSIILMHDRLQRSLDASAVVIPELKRRGYEFVFVSELLAQPRASGQAAAGTAMGAGSAGLAAQLAEPAAAGGRSELPVPAVAVDAPVAVPRTSAPRAAVLSESHGRGAAVPPARDETGLPVPSAVIGAQ